MGNSCGLPAFGKKAATGAAPEEKDREVEVAAGEPSTLAEELTKETEVKTEEATPSEEPPKEPTPPEPTKEEAPKEPTPA